MRASSGLLLLVLLDWPAGKRLVGVAPDGTVQTSADGGRTWTAGGTVAGSPAALTTHGSADVYVATESAIHRSTDNGKTFAQFQALG